MNTNSHELRQTFSGGPAKVFKSRRDYLFIEKSSPNAFFLFFRGAGWWPQKLQGVFAAPLKNKKKKLGRAGVYKQVIPTGFGRRAKSCPCVGSTGNQKSKIKNQKWETWSLLLAIIFFGIGATRAGEQVLTVAIFDFESKDEAVRNLGPQISTLLSATLSAEPQIITVDRAELEKIMSEQELGLSGTISADTKAKLGNLTGAKVLVTGRVFKADKDTIAVAKIISTETSRVYGELAKGGPGTSITDIAGELSKKIAATVTQKGETLVAKVETPEERVAKIKKALGSAKLPVVSVKITERHFGGPVIDPAAETELGLLLQQCGFKLVDDKSPDKPDVEITGEAFSTFGMRKGNLVSCRARLEVKAQKRTGEIIAVERQTSVGVDLGEQVAAKTALQNATAELTERLLPKLAK